MITEHVSYVRKEKIFDLNKPVDTAKFLLENSFGLVGTRPIFRDLDENNNQIKMVNPEYIFNLMIGTPNIQFVNDIIKDDVSTFTIEEYGKYFYELGRSTLTIAALSLTRAKWYIEHEDTVKYFDEYFSTLINLSRMFDDVLTYFKPMINGADYKFNFNYSAFFDALIQEYENIGTYKSTKDIANDFIALSVYVGLSLVELGALLVMPSDIDPISYLSGSINKSSVEALLKNSLSNSDMNEKTKSNFIKICAIEFIVQTLYVSTSGIDCLKQDFIFSKICEFNMTIVKSMDKETSAELFKPFEYLLNITGLHNPFTEINRLADSLPKCDNCDLWKFGTTYLRFYDSKIVDPDSNLDILAFYEPQMKGYIENVVKTIKDEDIERGFNFVSAILNGLSNSKISTVDPGTIFCLTMVGATFRKLEKDGYFGNEIISSKIHSAIDIIDIIIVSLYNLWFNSGKYFVQPKRPDYCGKSVGEVLKCLRKETNDILCVYMEYIRFGTTDKIYKSDENLFKDFFKNKFMCGDNDIGDEDFITTKLFLSLEPESFVKECALHSSRSIVYSILTKDKELFIDSLCEKSSTVELPKQVLRALASKNKENFTGITVIDKLINARPMIMEYLQENAFIYMLSVYCVLFDAIQRIFKENNVGNYFDFGKAEEAMDSYKLDSIVNELVYKPVKEIEDSYL